MKRQPSYGFNKEKLVFIGTSALLAVTVLYMFTSAPVKLDVSRAVSALSQPSPLDPEPDDKRVTEVRYYLDNSGGMVSVYSGLPVDRSRKNPFEPIDDFHNAIKEMPDPTGVAKGPVPNGKNGKLQPPPEAPPPDAPPAEEVAKPEPKKWSPNSPPKAKVDFSAVMSMNGQTVGLLKTKDGDTTMQVRVGDYLDEFKYTVAKIEKQAIWVTDENNRLFVARDTSFEDSSAGGGDTAAEDKPAAPKRANPKLAGKPTAPGTGAAHGGATQPAGRTTAPNTNTNTNGAPPKMQRPKGGLGGMGNH